MNGRIDSVKIAIARKIDIPKEIICGDPKLIIIGDKEIIIENHRGIISFSDYNIHIDTKYGELIIDGTDFEILYLGGNTLTLSGKFKGVYYVNN
ncbi:MAG: sporulation protein YqfC [Clostridium sp.]